MIPRLVASDLDGTLLRDDETVSRRTAAALAGLAAAGIPMVLATGRPRRTLAEVYAQLPIRPLAVCANGAAVYDPVTDSLPYTVELPADTLARACALIRAGVPDAVFAVELDGGTTTLVEPGFRVPRAEQGLPSVRLATLPELTARPAAKLVVKTRDTGVAIADVEFTRRLTAAVNANLGGLAEATYSSDCGMAEVAAPGVSKAAGLAWVAELYAVPPRDVLVFGDMPNDLEMFAWAGRGVAVAGAHPAVLAAATGVTGDNDEDGVAAYLERLLDSTECDIRRTARGVPAEGATIGG